jgi:hypothetical protein
VSNSEYDTLIKENESLKAQLEDVRGFFYKKTREQLDRVLGDFMTPFEENYIVDNQEKREYIILAIAMLSNQQSIEKVMNATNLTLEEVTEINEKVVSQKIALEIARKEGFAEGVREGRVEGRVEEIENISWRLLDTLPLEAISQKTGLSMKELKKLKKEYSEKGSTRWVKIGVSQAEKYNQLIRKMLFNDVPIEKILMIFTETTVDDIKSIQEELNK